MKRFRVAMADDFNADEATEGGQVYVRAGSLVDAILIAIRENPRWCFLRAEVVVI